MSLITCRDLSWGYDGKAIIKNISFSVNQGEYLCILGENGSGKSTLMKTILKLIPAINGEIIMGDGLSQNQIGYLPQQNEIQKDFPASVMEIVLSGCLNQCGMRPFYNRSEKKRAFENIEKMGISHLTKRCYRELSGGQQQRVLLARALCSTQKLLLLDEPVAGLDPKAMTDMYNLIDNLNKENGIAVIMISHDIDAAVKYASHILNIDKENKIYFGTKLDYINKKANRGDL